MANTDPNPLEGIKVTYVQSPMEVHPDLHAQLGEHGEKIKYPKGSIVIWGQKTLKKLNDRKTN